MGAAQPLLLANENIPAPAVRWLRDHGYDVEAVAERMPGATDEKVLNLAHHDGRWLLTFDRDYGELVYTRRLPSPPAIFYLRITACSPTAPGELIARLLEQPEQFAGFFVVLDAKRWRRRALPKLDD